VRLVIYSSGSVAAQQLLFAHTTDGDLTGLLGGYHDTVTAGPKVERESYERIAGGFEGGRFGGAQAQAEGKKDGEALKSWLFLSDNVQEVDAARAAGMQALVVVREGNAELSEEDRRRHVVVQGLDEVRI